MIFNKFDAVTEIEKGWSGDKKYCAIKGDTKYLLRISPIKKYKNRKKIHKIMQTLADNDIPMCKPIKIGLCKEGIYVLQSWIDGVDAEENIHNYDKRQQYNFGFQSGTILQKIHSIPAPKNQQDWETRFNNKIDRKIKMYSKCYIKFDGAEFRLIDLECLGYSNPYLELFELALCWSGYESCKIDFNLFNAFIKSYFDNTNLDTNIDWEALYYCNNGRLGWLEYNIKRALMLECDTEAEQQLGISEVKETVEHIIYYDKVRDEILKNFIIQ